MSDWSGTLSRSERLTDETTQAGPAQAQQQLSHAKLAATEAHYLQRQTRGPDVRSVLDKYAGGDWGD